MDSKVIFIGSVILGIAAYLFFKKQQSSQIQDIGGTNGYDVIYTPSTSEADTTAQKAAATKTVTANQASGIAPQGGVITATQSQLKIIGDNAVSHPDVVISYPALGIATAGGLGYSTAFPEQLLNSVTIKPAATKASLTSTVTSTSSNPLINASSSNILTKAAVSKGLI